MPPKQNAVRPSRSRPRLVAVSPVRRAVLEIEFSGLCALVLNSKQPGRATEARVLLVAGERALGYTSQQIATEGRKWGARLCVPRANLADTTAADETIESHGGDQLAAWRLDGPSILTIENDSGDPLVVRSGSRASRLGKWKEQLPSPKEPPDDISWLPEMERIVKGAGKLKAGLWDGWGGASGPLSGKVMLRSGLIESIQTSSRVYEFREDSGKAVTDYRQCFANGVRVRIWLREKKAKLRLTGPDRLIELVESPEDLPIRASITNHSGTSEASHTSTGDPHFKAFFALSDTGYRLSPVQRFSPFQVGGGPIRSKVRPCLGIELYE